MEVCKFVDNETRKNLKLGSFSFSSRLFSFFVLFVLIFLSFLSLFLLGFSLCFSFWVCLYSVESTNGSVFPFFLVYFLCLCFFFLTFFFVLFFFLLCFWSFISGSLFSLLFLHFCFCLFCYLCFFNPFIHLYFFFCFLF